MVVCRLVQGLGGSVFPLSFAMVRDLVSPARVGSAIGVLTGGFGAGSLLGYSAGGLIRSAARLSGPSPTGSVLARPSPPAWR